MICHSFYCFSYCLRSGFQTNGELSLDQLLHHRTESPTPRSWSALAHCACHHCPFSDAFDGSAMHVAWSLTACQEKSFMENFGRASVAWVDRCCATRTSSSETCDLHLSTPVHGRTSPITEIHGCKVSKWGFQRRKRTLGYRLHARERRGKNVQPLRVFPKARLRHLQQRLPLQDRATQPYKILPKSPALTIASSRRGCHYY